MAKSDRKSKGPHICVADDSNFTRQIIIQALQEIGLQNISEASNGEEALESIQHRLPALIISDWDMPHMGGIELLRAVRSYAPCRDVPFLLISSAPNRDMLLMVAKEERAQFLPKPFSIPEFKDRVRRMLVKKELKEFDTDISTLVVDDLASARKIMTKMLSDLGFSKVCSAENGLQALEIIQSGAVQLVISDWDMPEMTGLDLLKWVRANPQWKSIIFIMVTALSDKDRVVQAMKAGVSSYLIKPFDTATLEDKLRSALPEKKKPPTKKD